jgi:hypothetical protein
MNDHSAIGARPALGGRFRGDDQTVVTGRAMKMNQFHEEEFTGWDLEFRAKNQFVLCSSTGLGAKLKASSVSKFWDFLQQTV